MNEIITHKLVADSKVLLDDLQELIAATAGLAGTRFAELRQSLERKIAAGRAELSACEKEWCEQAEPAKGRAMTYLQKESWSRLVLAVALGLLLGLALRRVRR